MDLKKAIHELAEEARDLHVPVDVIELEECPSAIEFLRDFVSTNTPVVIRNGAHHWPALEKWSPEYLDEKVGENMVHVAYSPTGYADAEVNGEFILPEERIERFSKISNYLIENGKNREKGEIDWSLNGVPYIQFQNNSFHEEFSPLLQDVECPSFCKEVFGTDPEATNFWMGPDEAHTSMHKDMYENIYVVVKGSKIFTLCPPTDLGYQGLHYHRYPVKQYLFDGEKREWRVVDVGGETPWIPSHVDKQMGIRGLLYQRKRNALVEECESSKADGLGCEYPPLRVELFAGDVLYLPSSWYHRVEQRAGKDYATIAVNFWFDAKYNSRYAYYSMVERLLENSAEHCNCNK